MATALSTVLNIGVTTARLPAPAPFVEWGALIGINTRSTRDISNAHPEARIRTRT